MFTLTPRRRALLPVTLALLSAVLVVAALTAVAVLTATAQDGETPSPTPTATPVDCSAGGIAAAQAELALALRDLGTRLQDDEEAALADLYEVGAAYQDIALACGFIPDDIGTLFVGTDIDRIMTALAEVPGDPLNGQLLYNNVEFAANGEALGCIGCHNAEEVAPLTEGTWTRWDEIRSQLPQFADYTFERYVVESIVHPWDYTVPGYPEFTMPNNYGERLSYQDLADLIAYLNGQDQLID